MFTVALVLVVDHSTSGLRGSGVPHIMDRLLQGDDGGVVVTFTFTQSVEFDGAELVGLSDREIIERARGLVASQYDGHMIDGAHLLLGDADANLENMGA